MSKSIPTFRNGDRVRVMQTDDMVRRGIANERGIVFAVWSEPNRNGWQECFWCCARRQLVVVDATPKQGQ